MVSNYTYFSGLWRNKDFMKLWSGETVSLFGSQISALALPFLAAITLEATPAEMGFMNAAGFAPFLLLTLFAGVWIDRARRLPILIWSNVGRALLLGVIPLSFWSGFLRMELLYFLTFFIGLLTVLFDLAYQSYLPSLVGREQLVEGNSKLQASASIADVGGRGLAGLLIDWLTAPFVILFDAFSYLISAVSLSLIRQQEMKPPIALQQHKSIWQDIGIGFRVVYGNATIRAMAGEAATYNLFNQVTWTVLILYITRDLHVPATFLGFIMVALSVGSLVGSLYAGYAEKRFGLGRTIVGSMMIGCTAPILLPFAAGPSYVVVPILLAYFFLAGFGVVIQNIHVVSVRQSITPVEFLGRLSAAYRFIVTGAAAIGALLGGSLGTLIGLRLTLLVGALGTLSAVIWILFSPIPHMTERSNLSTPA